MSDVSAGAVMTLAIPLGLLVIVLAFWAVERRWLQLRGTGSGRSLPKQPPDA